MADNKQMELDQSQAQAQQQNQNQQQMIITAHEMQQNVQQQAAQQQQQQQQNQAQQQNQQQANGPQKMQTQVQVQPQVAAIMPQQHDAVAVSMQQHQQQQQQQQQQQAQQNQQAQSVSMTLSGQQGTTITTMAHPQTVQVLQPQMQNQYLHQVYTNQGTPLIIGPGNLLHPANINPSSLQSFQASAQLAPHMLTTASTGQGGAHPGAAGTKVQGFPTNYIPVPTSATPGGAQLVFSSVEVLPQHQTSIQQQQQQQQGNNKTDQVQKYTACATGAPSGQNRGMQFASPWPFAQGIWTTGMQSPTALLAAAPNQIFIRDPSDLFIGSPQTIQTQHSLAAQQQIQGVQQIATTGGKPRIMSIQQQQGGKSNVVGQRPLSILPSLQGAPPANIRPASSVSTQTNHGVQASVHSQSGKAVSNVGKGRGKAMVRTSPGPNTIVTMPKAVGGQNAQTTVGVTTSIASSMAGQIPKNQTHATMITMQAGPVPTSVATGSPGSVGGKQTMQLVQTSTGNALAGNAASVNATAGQTPGSPMQQNDKQNFVQQQNKQILQSPQAQAQQQQAAQQQQQAQAQQQAAQQQVQQQAQQQTQQMQQQMVFIQQMQQQYQQAQQTPQQIQPKPIMCIPVPQPGQQQQNVVLSGDRPIMPVVSLNPALLGNPIVGGPHPGIQALPAIVGQPADSLQAAAAAAAQQQMQQAAAAAQLQAQQQQQQAAQPIPTSMAQTAQVTPPEQPATPQPAPSMPLLNSVTPSPERGAPNAPGNLVELQSAASQLMQPPPPPATPAIPITVAVDEVSKHAMQQSPAKKENAMQDESVANAESNGSVETDASVNESLEPLKPGDDKQPPTSNPLANLTKAVNSMMNGCDDTSTMEPSILSTPTSGKQMPPKAMVKPQVLTHVIEGFVIQEASEPFTVNRPPHNGSISQENSINRNNSADKENHEEPLAKRKKFYMDGDQSLQGGKCEACGNTLDENNVKLKKDKRFCSTICAKSKKKEIRDNGENKWTDMDVDHKNDIDMKKNGDDKAHNNMPNNNGVNNNNNNVNNVSLDDSLPKINPVKWTVNEVCDFIRNLPGCADYAEDFAIQEIDGQALMLLKEDHLMSAMSIKLGPALKIVAKIDSMRADNVTTNTSPVSSANA